MSKKKKYQVEFSQILDSVDFIQKVNNDKEMNMNNVYIDEYTTREQRLRDRKITELLSQYVDAYTYKNKSNKWYKGVMFGTCLLILISFCIVFIILMFKGIGYGDKVSTKGIVQLISVCVTFLTLIVSILKTITKYVFPKKEEEYITRIVEIIQNNDLENKKENINVKTKIHKETEEDIIANMEEIEL